MTYNHDPRIPPIGRIASAKIIQLGDGEYAVEGDLELFEADDPMEPEPCARSILTRRYPPNSLYLGFDRNYDNQEDQELIADICESLHIEARFEAKKALDPISILTIAGAFVMAQIAGEFFRRLGADGYGLSRFFSHYG